MIRFNDMYTGFSESPKTLKINIPKTINYNKKICKKILFIYFALEATIKFS